MFRVSEWPRNGLLRRVGGFNCPKSDSTDKELIATPLRIIVLTTQFVQRR